MTEDKFEVGDVVSLKSGGCLMTVTDVNKNGLVWCTFFHKDELRNVAIPQAAISIDIETSLPVS